MIGDLISSEKLDQISSHDLDYVLNHIWKKAGVKISPDKVALVENRLRSRLHALNLDTYSDYIGYLRENEIEETPFFIDVMTTHTTHFFRESKHFTLLREYIENGSLQYNQRVNIWCAACSTGEEAYTLAIVCEQIRQKNKEFDYRILATDISSPSLASAEKGIFDKNRMSEIPAPLLSQYFKQNSSRTKIMVKPVLRDKIKFRRLNLADPDLHAPIKFDVVFLRNVLIYFNDELISRVGTKIYEGLSPGGHLFIGFSESLGKARELFEDVDVAVFKRVK